MSRKTVKEWKRVSRKIVVTDLDNTFCHVCINGTTFYLATSIAEMGDTETHVVCADCLFTEAK